ncbi:MAG: hypothetical protein WAO55_14060 [Candidatus Manganitrophaceae bacterium]
MNKIRSRHFTVKTTFLKTDAEKMKVGIRAVCIPSRLRLSIFPLLWMSACIGLLVVVSAGGSLAGTKSENKPRSQNAALAFRAVVTEVPASAESVLRKMPAGLASKDKEWPDDIKSAWKAYFGASFIHIGQAESNNPIFAYYNPFSDVVVIGIWEFSGTKSPNVTKICALPADHLRAPASTAPRAPSWLKAGDPFGKISSTAPLTMGALESTFPHDATFIKKLPSELCTSDLQRLAEQRLLDLVSGVAGFIKAGAIDPLSNLIKAAAQGEEAVAKAFPGLSKPEIDLVSAIGPNMAKLAPAVVIEKPAAKGYIIVLTHAQSAQRFVAIDLKNASDGIALARVSQLNLFAGGLQK